MRHSKPNLACIQDDAASHAQRQLTEALSQLNEHASTLQSHEFDERSVAKYICDLLFELSSISSKANLVFLTYLIDVAHEEARLRSQESETPYL